MKIKLALLVLSCLLFSGFTLASGLYLEQIIGNETDEQYDARIIGYANSGTLIIFTSNSIAVPGYTGANNPQRYHQLYVKDLSTGTVKRLSEHNDGALLAEDFDAVRASYIDETKTLYVSSKPSFHTHKLYSYSFETEVLTHIPLPKEKSFKLMTAANGTVYILQENVFVLTDSSTSPSAITPPEACGFSPRDTTDNGELLVLHCHKFYLYNPRTLEYRNLSAELPELYYRQEGSKISGDGRYLITSSGSLIIKYDLENKNFETFDISHFGLRNYTSDFIREVNLDGSEVLMTVGINNQINARQEEQQIARPEWQYMHYELSANASPVQINWHVHDSNIINNRFNHYRFDDVSNNIVAIGATNNETGVATSYALSLEDIRNFQLPPTFVNPQLDITTDSPYFNQISVNEQDNLDILYRIKRSSEYSGTTTHFWLAGNHFNDLALGLLHGVNHYEVTACNVNLICDEKNAVTKSMTTHEFTNDNRWTFQATSNDDNEIEIRLTGLTWDNATSIRIRDFNKGYAYDVSGDSYKLELNDDHSLITLGIQPCITSSTWDTITVCANWVNVKELLIPKTTYPAVRLSPAYDFAKIYFEQHEQWIYHLEKRQNSSEEFVRLASHVQSGFQDPNIVPGETYQYRIITCDKSQNLCRKGGTRWQTVKTLNSFDINTDTVKPNSVKLRFDNLLATDSVNIFRGTETEEYSLITTLFNGQEIFTDVQLTPGVKYWYRVQGILDDEVIQEDEAKVTTEGRDARIITSEETINSITVDQSYTMGYLVSWNEVENAFAYQLEVTDKNATILGTYRTDGRNATQQFITHQNVSQTETIRNLIVTPYIRGCAGHDSQCWNSRGAAFTLHNVLIEPKNDVIRLYPPELKVSQQSQDSLTIQFSHHFLYDWYKLYRKTADSETWQSISFMTPDSWSYSDRFTLTPQEQYHYRLEACSFIMDQCVSREITEAVTFLGPASNEAPAAPNVDIEHNRILVALSPPQNTYVNRAEILINFASGREFNWETTDLNEPLSIYASHLYEDNEEIAVRLRYCFNNEYLNWRENCTGYSEQTRKIVPQSIDLNRPQVSSLNIEFSNETSTMHIKGEFRNDRYYSSPEQITLYRAVANQDFNIISTQEIEPGNATEFEFADANVEPGRNYQYAVMACNEIGCSRFNSAIYNYHLPQTNLPQKPVIAHISYSEFISHIHIDVKSLAGISNYYFYRSGQENGEYEQIHHTTVVTHTFRDTDLESDTVFWYKVEACNDNGCTASDAIKGKTNSEFYQAPLTVDNGNMRTLLTERNDLIQSDGDIRALDGVLEAFVGTLTFNQWIDTSQGMQISNQMWLDPVENECAALLTYQVFIPNMSGRFWDDNHEVNLASMLYTGSGCPAFPDLQAHSYYLTSDYLSAPVLIEQDIERTWLPVQILIDSVGSVSYNVGSKELAISASLFPNDALKHVKVKLTGRPEFNDNFAGYVTDVSLSGNAISNPGPLNIISRNPPRLDAVHASSIGLQLLNSNNLRPEYRLITAEGYSDNTTLNRYKGGRYNAYIHNLPAGKTHRILMRYCDDNQCGPYEYTYEETEEYSELASAGLIQANFQEDGSILIKVSNYSVANIDQFTILRKVEGVDEEPTVLAEFTIQELLDYWLTYTGDYTLTDQQDSGMTVSYFRMSCNPYGCITNEQGASLTVPADSDGDGVYDPFDDFPENPDESVDTDNDGVGNNADNDDDNDGIPDSIESEFGMDPLSRQDAVDDMDGDQFTNFYEYMAGSEMNNPDSLPAQYGLFSSFEQETEPFFEISDSAIRQNFAVHGDYSLFANFREGINTLTIKATGLIHEGHIVFSEPCCYTRILSVKINGEELPLPRETTSMFYAYDWYDVAIPVPSYDEVATLELVLSANFHHWYALTLDRLFFPMTPGIINDKASVADYDGDGKSDFAVRNGQVGINYVLTSSDNEIQRHGFGKQESDILLDGDFDGDGLTDVAFRRPSNATWYIKNSDGSNYNSTREDGIQRITFGTKSTDIPVPADFDGDGITDIAFRRPDNFTWYIRNSSGSNYNSELEDGIQRIQFGRQENDIPVPADYDGDGKADIAVRRPGNFTWYILESSTNQIRRVQFGKQSTDIPVPADYDGDGKADIAVRRPDNRHWYILKSSDQQILRVRFGLQLSDIPVVGDYDGDHKADIAVRRPGNGMWYVLRSSDNEIMRQQFGRHAHMVPALAPVWEKLLMSGWRENYLFGISNTGSKPSGISDIHGEFEAENHSLSIDEFYIFDDELGSDEKIRLNKNATDLH